MSGAAGFADRLAARIDAVGSPLCVGIDPVIESMPDVLRAPGEHAATTFSRFCDAVIDAVRGVAAAVKLQAACFERCGAPGWEALAGAVEIARASGLLVVLDGKRGDIGVSAQHYAFAAADTLGVDAVTVNAYLGPSGIRPFLDAGLGVFCLVRTSNPDSDAIQNARLADGRTVAHLVASMVAELGRDAVGARGLSGVGAVVGATKAGDAASAVLRQAMPDQVMLIPGVGTQGGRVEDLAPLMRPTRRGPSEAGVLVTASRSVTYPGAHGSAWSKAVTAQAIALADDLASLCRRG